MNNSVSTCKKALIEASVWSASSAYRQNSCAEGFDNTHGVAVIRHIESKYQLGDSSANADTCQSVGVTVVASRELGPECKFLPESSIMDVIRLEKLCVPYPLPACLHSTQSPSIAITVFAPTPIVLSDR